MSPDPVASLPASAAPPAARPPAAPAGFGAGVFAAPGSADFPGFLRHYWLVLLAAILFAVPAIYQLGTTWWSTGIGAHGPIIMATGLWLLWFESAGLHAEQDPRRSAIALAALALFGLAAVYGSIINKNWLHWGASYAALVAALAVFLPVAGLRRLWFPLVYLMFLIPPPASVIFTVTRELKLALSQWSVALLSSLGYEVASSGASLYIDSYELVVAAACSGMNSLVSLLAVGLFYVYLRHRADWRYALILALLIIPIAIAANFLRVIFLLLSTHYFGEEITQSLLHDAAGFTVFIVTLLGLFGVDMVLMPLYARYAGRAA